MTRRLVSTLISNRSGCITTQVQKFIRNQYAKHSENTDARITLESTKPKIVTKQAKQ